MGIRRPSDIAFSPAVKAQQSARGSRELYARVEEKRPWNDTITEDLARFIGAQTSVFFGTASASGQPYIQHRGGPAGFLKVLGERELGFADLAGNKQYITLGNLSENPQAFLFLVDYAQRRRIKLWGRARVIEDDPQLVAQLRTDGGEGRPERAILFDVATWDVNCQQHIPQRFEAEDVAAALAARDERIARLEARLAAFTGAHVMGGK
ncbi:pyridoxamine 5'-phosphate oxidase family protein [Marinibacterium profundimaris]|uniref:Pyridoxamine 5'-phosphate oxidase n=1 Tax=Marinibacterium profundimaris TaxID=1679460 RepID=A0A225NRL6_9RHOB|nr:pyridoxamine 5'-phosphate oxidase family protein [Marinibacterium profundimaris]OWU77584.1 pyridoxamine 5'-phosphate oxidase [Marinibacterium profundimaris]